MGDTTTPATGGHDKDYAWGLYDDKYYDVIRDNEQRRSHRWRLRWVELCLEPHAGDRIVDLGCGAGMVTRYLASRGAICHGVDLAPTAIEYARKANAEYPGNTFEVGDASALPHLASGSFDKAVSADVTEHCGYDIMMGIFAEALRLLRPGGLYYTYTPNPLHWIERLKKWGILRADATHTGLRTAPVIIDALKKSGFEIVRHLEPTSMFPIIRHLERVWQMQPIGRQLAIYRVAVLARKPA
jgi:SAM-dependent methyltransferase